MKELKELDHTLISKLREYFSGQPVLRAWLFGSVARGEERPDSDIDILVSFDPSANVGLFKHASMIGDLEELMKKAVDLVPAGSLFPWVQPYVDNEKILIYERETA